jgi:hypothetical protein
MKAEYVLWFTFASLLFAVGMLGYRANHRHGFGPLSIGLLAAILIILGKFYLRIDNLSYAGIFLLVTASVWNAWPRKGSSSNHLKQYKKNIG